MKMSLPNFLIVGAAKSGTTSLYYYLKEHPQVYMAAVKEPRFFNAEIYTRLSSADPRCDLLRRGTIFTLEKYQELFQDAGQAIAIGEATATYLYDYLHVIPQIKTHLHAVKIIICLRNPVQRAFSSYNHLIRDQFENRSFEDCLDLEAERIEYNWSALHFYRAGGLYYEQVKAYLENFDQVKVYLYDDLRQNPLSVIEDMYQFLEIDPTFKPDTATQYNVSGIPKSRFVYQFLTESNLFKRMLKPVVDVILPKEQRNRLIEQLKTKSLTKSQLNPQTKAQLLASFKADILQLQTLIQRDLSHWLA